MTPPRIELRDFRRTTVLFRASVHKITECRRAWREAPSGGTVTITRTAWRRVWGWLWWRKAYSAIVFLQFDQLPDPVLEKQLSPDGLGQLFWDTAISTNSRPLILAQRATLANA